MAKQKPSWEPE